MIDLDLKLEERKYDIINYILEKSREHQDFDFSTTADRVLFIKIVNMFAVIPMNKITKCLGVNRVFGYNFESFSKMEYEKMKIIYDIISNDVLTYIKSLTII